MRILLTTLVFLAAFALFDLARMRYGAKLRDILEGRARRVLAAAAIIALAFVFLGCGTLKGQVQLGSDLSHPSAKTLESHVCRGDDSAARLYLALPEYAWLGAGALERYFTDAKDYEFQGRCPCAGKGCPSNGGK